MLAGGAAAAASYIFFICTSRYSSRRSVHAAGMHAGEREVRSGLGWVALRLGLHGFARQMGSKRKQGITAPVRAASCRQPPSSLLCRHELLPLLPFCHLSPADAELAWWWRP